MAVAILPGRRRVHRSLVSGAGAFGVEVDCGGDQVEAGHAEQRDSEKQEAVESIEGRGRLQWGPTWFLSCIDSPEHVLTFYALPPAYRLSGVTSDPCAWHGAQWRGFGATGGWPAEGSTTDEMGWAAR